MRRLTRRLPHLEFRLEPLDLSGPLAELCVGWPLADAGEPPPAAAGYWFA
jgi:hypothetical protein